MENVENRWARILDKTSTGSTDDSTVIEIEVDRKIHLVKLREMSKSRRLQQ